MFADPAQLAVFVLAAIAVGAAAWALFSPQIAKAERVEKRVKHLSSRETVHRQVRNTDGQSRRNRVQEALKDIEEKQKKASAKVSLRLRIQQAGLNWSMRKFVLISAAIGIAAFFIALILGLGLPIAAAKAFAAAFGLPRWIVNFLRKRRQNAFLNEFANSVDVIVRGVKAGLPLNDCIRIVAQESAEPVRGEFRQVVEAQQLGVSTAEAIERMYDRMPLAEVNFLSIVINIQQKAGGNLAETLANLSKVLRDRKKMKAKVQAMSMEAKASAAIIGALPIAVMFLVYVTTPDYIALLWTERLGQVMLAASAMWMFCGIMVMRRMINFDF